MTHEFQWPNDEIRHAGWSLLSEFQNEVFAALENILEPLFGPDWFHKCINRDMWPGKTPEKELYVFLKETVQFSNQNFRVAMAKAFLGEDNLTKKEIDALEKILHFRNLWSHEPAEKSKRITQSNLRELAINIQRFTINESLLASCKSAIEAKDLADLLLSLPVVARHLPVNVKNKEQMAKVSEILRRSELNSGSGIDSSMKVSELLSALTATLHAWQKTDLRFDLLSIKYRLLQLQVLNKVHLDTNTLMANNFCEENYGLTFADQYAESNILEGMSFTSEKISGLIEQAIGKVLSDIEKYKVDSSTFTEVESGDECECEYCLIVPTMLSPFNEEDAELNEFIKSEIFNPSKGVRFFKLKEELEN
jgi:hypothetical protein